jgi:hypothetical protein
MAPKSPEGDLAKSPLGDLGAVLFIFTNLHTRACGHCSHNLLCLNDPEMQLQRFLHFERSCAISTEIVNPGKTPIYRSY